MKILLPNIHFSELTITRLLHIHTEFPYTHVYIHEFFCWFLKSEINYSYYFKFCFFSGYLGSLCLNCLACEMDKEAVRLSGLL